MKNNNNQKQLNYLTLLKKCIVPTMVILMSLGLWSCEKKDERAINERLSGSWDLTQTLDAYNQLQDASNQRSGIRFTLDSFNRFTNDNTDANYPKKYTTNGDQIKVYNKSGVEEESIKFKINYNSTSLEFINSNDLTYRVYTKR